MADIPFDVVRCSWPRPVRHTESRWLSEPEWDAPAMPYGPQPAWTMVGDEIGWAIDWRRFFMHWLDAREFPYSGEMRGFHVVFAVRLRRGGRLVFWDDDGCIVRRGGQVIHEDRGAHMLTRHEIAIADGDVLEVAQWQLGGDWQWAGRLAGDDAARAPIDVTLEALAAVQARLAHPEGPPLKLFCDGKNPVRTSVAVYSLILNGYAPDGVWLFGEHQWDPEAREVFARALGFAHVVPTEDVMHRVASVGGARAVVWARQHWFVFKTFVGLVCPPEEFCLIDDDVVILEDLTDALSAFERHDLVFTPDTDHSDVYLKTWGWMHGVRTAHLASGTFNAGLYWLRAGHDPRKVARQALRVPPGVPWVWEQGFIASLYARSSVLALPSQRYFYPLFDGLPGGPLGYDYATNPCAFASIHFGGLVPKPSDAAMRELAPAILGRRTSGAR